MSEAAAAIATDPTTAAPEEAEPEAKKPDAPGPKVERLRSFLRNQREMREQRATGIAEERGTKTKAAREEEETAKAKEKSERIGKERADAKEAKDKPAEPAADKREAKAEKPEPAAKDKPSAGPERDASGRFQPKEGATPKSEPKAEAKPAPAQPAEPAARVEEKPKAEEPPKPPVDHKLEEQLSRMTLDIRRKDAELAQVRARAKRADELEALQKRVSGAEIDEDALEKLIGRDFAKLVIDVRDMNAGNGVVFKAKSKLPPEALELKQRLDKIEQEKREAEERVQREEQQKAQRETIQREAGIMQTYVNSAVEDYPYLSGAADAGERLLRAWYSEWSMRGNAPSQMPTKEEVAKKLESVLSSQIDAILGTERGLKTAFKNAKTRETALKILGLQTADPQPTQPQKSPQRENPGNQTATSDGPRTLNSKVTQEVPTHREPRTLTEEERKARREEGFAKWRAARGK